MCRVRVIGESSKKPLPLSNSDKGNRKTSLHRFSVHQHSARHGGKDTWKIWATRTCKPYTT
nr:MAG TPA: hypothetical protein [Caudoviricetes sp.]